MKIENRDSLAEDNLALGTMSASGALPQQEHDWSAKGPIFITGLERSGTSLLYALLASHPNLAMTRRTNLWTYFYNQFGDLSQPENLDRCLAQMMRYKRLVVLKPDAQRIRREFLQGECTYGRLFELLQRHHAERLAKPRWGDKSLNTDRFTDHIFAAYPNARMLHIIRDPRDRYASSRTRWHKMRGLTGAATAMWLSSMNRAERNRRNYPKNYLIVRYESLTAQPEETLRQICSFIGEGYSPLMLEMSGARKFREAGGNSSYGQRQSGISTNSIGRFRQVMSTSEIAFFQACAGRRMTAYHYQLDPVRFSLQDRLRFYTFDFPVNLARLWAWRLREAFQDRVGRKLPAYRIVPDPALRNVPADKIADRP